MGNSGDSEKPDAVIEIKGVTKRFARKLCLRSSNIRLSRRASVPHSSDGHDCNCLACASVDQGIAVADFDLKGRILTLTRSIVAATSGTAENRSFRDEVFLDSKLVSFWRIAETMCRNAGAWLFANADTKRRSMAMPFRKTTCDQRAKRSDCKEWAGTAFGTPIEAD